MRAEIISPPSANWYSSEVACTSRSVFACAAYNYVCFLSLEQPHQLQDVLLGHGNKVTCICAAHDDKQEVVVSGGRDRALVAWLVGGRRRMLRKRPKLPGEATAMCAGAPGTVVVACGDQSLCSWSWAQGGPLSRGPALPALATRLVSLPSNRTFVAGCSDGSVMAMDALTFSQKWRLDAGMMRSVRGSSASTENPKAHGTASIQDMAVQPAVLPLSDEAARTRASTLPASPVHQQTDDGTGLALARASEISVLLLAVSKRGGVAHIYALPAEASAAAAMPDDDSGLPETSALPQQATSDRRQPVHDTAASCEGSATPLLASEDAAASTSEGRSSPVSVTSPVLLHTLTMPAAGAHVAKNDRQNVWMPLVWLPPPHPSRSPAPAPRAAVDRMSTEDAQASADSQAAALRDVSAQGSAVPAEASMETGQSRQAGSHSVGAVSCLQLLSAGHGGALHAWRLTPDPAGLRSALSAPSPPTVAPPRERDRNRSSNPAPPSWRRNSSSNNNAAASWLSPARPVGGAFRAEQCNVPCGSGHTRTIFTLHACPTEGLRVESGESALTDVPQEATASSWVLVTTSLDRKLGVWRPQGPFAQPGSWNSGSSPSPPLTQLRLAPAATWHCSGAPVSAVACGRVTTDRKEFSVGSTAIYCATTDNQLRCSVFSENASQHSPEASQHLLAARLTSSHLFFQQIPAPVTALCPVGPLVFVGCSNGAVGVLRSDVAAAKSAASMMPQQHAAAVDVVLVRMGKESCDPAKSVESDKDVVELDGEACSADPESARDPTDQRHSTSDDAGHAGDAAVHARSEQSEGSWSARRAESRVQAPNSAALRGCLDVLSLARDGRLLLWRKLTPLDELIGAVGRSQDWSRVANAVSVTDVATLLPSTCADMIQDVSAAACVPGSPLTIAGTRHGRVCLLNVELPSSSAAHLPPGASLLVASQLHSAAVSALVVLPSASGSATGAESSYCVASACSRGMVIVSEVVHASDAADQSALRVLLQLEDAGCSISAMACVPILRDINAARPASTSAVEELPSSLGGPEVEGASATGATEAAEEDAGVQELRAARYLLVACCPGKGVCRWALQPSPETWRARYCGFLTGAKNTAAPSCVASSFSGVFIKGDLASTDAGAAEDIEGLVVHHIVLGCADQSVRVLLPSMHALVNEYTSLRAKQAAEAAEAAAAAAAAAAPSPEPSSTNARPELDVQTGSLRVQAKPTAAERSAAEGQPLPVVAAPARPAVLDQDASSLPQQAPMVEPAQTPASVVDAAPALRHAVDVPDATVPLQADAAKPPAAGVESTAAQAAVREGQQHAGAGLQSAGGALNGSEAAARARSEASGNSAAPVPETTAHASDAAAPARANLTAAFEQDASKARGGRNPDKHRPRPTSLGAAPLLADYVDTALSSAEPEAITCALDKRRGSGSGGDGASSTRRALLPGVLDGPSAAASCLQQIAAGDAVSSAAARQADGGTSAAAVRHRKVREAHAAALPLLWQGDVAGAVERVIDANALNADFVAIAAGAGPDAWRAVVKLYAAQLEVWGEVHLAAGYLCAAHAFKDAIAVYTRAGLLLEALLLAERHLPPFGDAVAQLRRQLALRLSRHARSGVDPPAVDAWSATAAALASDLPSAVGVLVQDGSAAALSRAAELAALVATRGSGDAGAAALQAHLASRALALGDRRLDQRSHARCVDLASANAASVASLRALGGVVTVLEGVLLGMLLQTEPDCSVDLVQAMRAVSVSARLNGALVLPQLRRAETCSAPPMCSDAHVATRSKPFAAWLITLVQSFQRGEGSDSAALARAALAGAAMELRQAAAESEALASASLSLRDLPERTVNDLSTVLNELWLVLLGTTWHAVAGAAPHGDAVAMQAACLKEHLAGLLQPLPVWLRGSQAEAGAAVIAVQAPPCMLSSMHACAAHLCVACALAMSSDSAQNRSSGAQDAPGSAEKEVQEQLRAASAVWPNVAEEFLGTASAADPGGELEQRDRLPERLGLQRDWAQLLGATGGAEKPLALEWWWAFDGCLRPQPAESHVAEAAHAATSPRGSTADASGAEGPASGPALVTEGMQAREAAPVVSVSDAALLELAQHCAGEAAKPGAMAGGVSLMPLHETLEPPSSTVNSDAGVGHMKQQGQVKPAPFPGLHWRTVVAYQEEEVALGPREWANLRRAAQLQQRSARHEPAVHGAPPISSQSSGLCGASNVMGTIGVRAADTSVQAGIGGVSVSGPGLRDDACVSKSCDVVHVAEAGALGDAATDAGAGMAGRADVDGHQMAATQSNENRHMNPSCMVVDANEHSAAYHGNFAPVDVVVSSWLQSLAAYPL